VPSVIWAPSAAVTVAVTVLWLLVLVEKDGANLEVASLFFVVVSEELGGVAILRTGETE
jgi:hypothetical protein